MPSLVWCPPGWCCGKLYLVPDTQAWTCPYSGVKAHTVVAEFDGLTWSKRRAMRQFFVRQRENLGLPAGGAGLAGLEGLLDPVGSTEDVKQRRRLCDLIRCVVGDPFRPLPPVQPAVLVWNDGVVSKLAARICQEWDFTRESMGVLADALEEAGLNDETALGHLRGPGPHTRGCFVLDLLTGRG